MKKTLQEGFTLIELIIVVAIIGILATIKLPACNDYLIRSRVAELINGSAVAKTAVLEYRVVKGTLPTTSTLAGVSNIRTKYISSLSFWALGIITIARKATPLGTGDPIAIILTPTYSNGVINWMCASSGAIQYAPSSCR